MVSMRGGKITHVPLSQVKDKLKLVAADNELIREGRRMDVCFGIDFAHIRTTLEK